MGFTDRAGNTATAGRKNFGNFTNTGIWKVQYELNSPIHVVPLSLYTIDLDLHFPKKGSGEGMSICNKMYFSKEDPDKFCEKCNELNVFGDPSKPVLYRVGLFYVFERVNQTYLNKDKEEKPINPVAVCEIPAGGSKKINFTEIQDAVEQDYFLSEVWKLQIREEDYVDKKTGEKKKRRVFQPPTIAPMKKIGKLFDPTVPEEVLNKYRTMSRGEVLGLILASARYGNIQWEHPDIVSEGIVRPDAPQNQSEEPTGTSEQDILD